MENDTENNNLHRITVLAVQESRTTNEDIRNLENEHPGLI